MTGTSGAAQPGAAQPGAAQPGAAQPGAAQIADLLAWARRLTEAGSRADQSERAAYQAAKAELLDCLTHHTTAEDLP